MTPTSSYVSHYFHQSSFQLNKNMLYQIWGSVSSDFGLVLSLFNDFATQPRLLSSVQLLVNKELFHQSSFYLINIASSVQLLFKQCYLHFFREKCPGGDVLDPGSTEAELLDWAVAEEPIRQNCRSQLNITDKTFITAHTRINVCNADRLGASAKLSTLYYDQTWVHFFKIDGADYRTIRRWQFGAI